jgi:inner membrane protein
MTGKGHTLVGLTCLIGIYHFTKTNISTDIVICLLSSLGLIFGSTAPDWMEMRRKSGGTIITHRTWTHWTPLWVFPLLILLYQYDSIGLKSVIEISFYNETFINSYVSSFLIGFLFGGVIHLLVDLPNPLGIPILTPYNRFSLKLWKSGKNETLITLLSLVLNLYYVGFISFNVDSILN